MSSPGTILSHTPRASTASNMSCDSATAVESAITSRLKSDNSMPGWPWVTPSHMAGTPPANWATAPASRAAFLISAGKRSSGWCAESISLYEDTMPRLGSLPSRRTTLSSGAEAAQPCARLVHDSRLRIEVCWRDWSSRARYAERVCSLRWRTRAVTAASVG